MIISWSFQVLLELYNIPCHLGSITVRNVSCISMDVESNTYGIIILCLQTEIYAV